MMVLSYFGRDVDRQELRELTGTDMHGASATNLLEAGKSLGLRGTAFKVGVERVGDLPPGAILHWAFNHFVVLSRLRRKGIEIADPASGRRMVSKAEFRKQFTGVALVFEPDEGFVTQKRRPWRWTDLLKYLRGDGLWPAIALASVLMQVLGLGVPILVGSLVDRVVPQGDTDLLALLAVAMATVLVLYGLMTTLRGYLLLFVRAHIDLRISGTFINRLVELPYTFFLQRGSGDLLARLNSNAVIRQILTTTALSAVLDGTTVMIYLAVLATQSIPMTLLVLTFLLVEVVVLVATWRLSQDLTRETLEAQAASQSQAVQLLAGIETVKALGIEERSSEKWTSLFTAEVDATLRRGKYSNLTDSLMAAIRLGAPVSLLVYGAYGVLEGDLSLGAVLTVNALALTMLGPAASLVGTILQFQMLPPYMERIEDVINTTAAPSGTAELPERPGALVVESVSFAYSRLRPRALDRVSFEVEPGRTVAIVGASGSGKSTLGSLLAGLHAPTSGDVTLHGLSLAEIAKEDLRAHVSLVPQHPYVFATSIRDNIALAHPDASLDDIERAAKLACLHDDIETMPGGYQTLLADAGASLSGGQRQRLAIARGLMGSPEVLILDEATSALDPDTEARVHENLRRLTCSKIVISHRLVTIQGADAILVLRDGRIVERGDHASLSVSGETYRQVFGFDDDRSKL